MTDEVETRTYEIDSISGRYRVTVPAAWKITFGAIVPGKGGGAASGSYGIRIWEAENKQRLVMDGVRWFRDISIPIQQFAVRKFGSEEWYVRHRGKDETVEKAWVDIDLVQDGIAPGDEPSMPDENDVYSAKREW